MEWRKFLTQLLDCILCLHICMTCELFVSNTFIWFLNNTSKANIFLYTIHAYRFYVTVSPWWSSYQNLHWNIVKTHYNTFIFFRVLKKTLHNSSKSVRCGVSFLFHGAVSIFHLLKWYHIYHVISVTTHHVIRRFVCISASYWPTFQRLYLYMHLLEGKYLYFEWNFS